MTITRPQLRQLASPLFAGLAAIALLAAGCSSTSSTSKSSDSHSSESSPGNGDAARETAETRLEAIGPRLGTVLADYRAGKRQQAYNLAKSVSDDLYEGTTEGIVSSIDPAGERQIDALLATTLPVAIHNADPDSQVAALVHQAQMLATSCLAAIHHSE